MKPLPYISDFQAGTWTTNVKHTIEYHRNITDPTGNFCSLTNCHPRFLTPKEAEEYKDKMNLSRTEKKKILVDRGCWIDSPVVNLQVGCGRTFSKDSFRSLKCAMFRHMHDCKFKGGNGCLQGYYTNCGCYAFVSDEFKHLRVSPKDPQQPPSEGVVRRRKPRRCMRCGKSRNGVLHNAKAKSNTPGFCKVAEADRTPHWRVPPGYAVGNTRQKETQWDIKREWRKICEEKEFVDEGWEGWTPKKKNYL